MWAQVKNISNNVQQLGLKARETASQIVSEVLESAEELSNQAQQWEKDEEGLEQRKETLPPVTSTQGPNPATSRLDALKARLEAERKKAPAASKAGADRRPGGASPPSQGGPRPGLQAAPAAVSSNTTSQNGSPEVRGAQGAAGGAEAQLTQPAQNGPLYASAPVRIATTGIPFGRRHSSPLREQPLAPETKLAEDEAKAAAAEWRTNHTFEQGGPAGGGESELEHLRGQMARLKEQIVSAAFAAEEEQEALCQEHAEHVAALEQEASALRTRVTDAETRLAEAASAATSPDAVSTAERLRETQRLLEESREEARALWAEAHAVNGAGGRSDVEAELAESRRLLRESQAEAVALRGELTAARREGESRAAAAGSQPLAAALKLLQAQLDAERDAHSATKAEVTALAGRVREAEEDAERAAAAVPDRDAFWKAELGRQEKHIGELNTRLEEAERLASQVTNIAARPVELESLVGELQTTVATLEARCQAAEARATAEEQRASDATAKADKLADEVVQSQSSASARLEAAVAAAHEESESSRAAVEAEWRGRLREAQAPAQESQLRLEADLCRQADAQLAAEEEAAKLQYRLGQLDGQLADAIAEGTAVRQALDRAEAARAEVQARCDALAGGEAGLARQMEEAAQKQASHLLRLEEELDSLRRAQNAALDEAAEQAAQAQSAREAATKAEESLLAAEAARLELEACLHDSLQQQQRLQEEVQGAAQQGDEAGAASSAAQLAQLTQQLAERTAALEEAEQEKERAKVQLARLKQAMVSEQEDEEDKLRWRVEAEVRLKVEEMRVEAEGQGQEAQALRADAAEAEARYQEAARMLSAWEAAVAARDEEIRNLQAALGELTYESEAAERLRGEVRALRAAERAARDEADGLRAARQRAEVEAQAAAEQVARARHGDADQQERERRLQEEGAMLRRALAESMKRIHLLNSDTNAMVDRRIVVKLLVTFFERGHSQEVLALMSRMLGFSDEEKRRVGIGVARKGVLGTVASVLAAPVRGTLAAVKGAPSPSAADGQDSLADSWIDFLIQQAEAADVADAENRQRAAHTGQPLSPSGGGGIADPRLQRSVSGDGGSTPRTPIFGPPR